jgi:hypothetical protein
MLWPSHIPTPTEEKPFVILWCRSEFRGPVCGLGLYKDVVCWFNCPQTTLDEEDEKRKEIRARHAKEGKVCRQMVDREFDLYELKEETIEILYKDHTASCDALGKPYFHGEIFENTERGQKFIKDNAAITTHIYTSMCDPMGMAGDWIRTITSADILNYTTKREFKDMHRPGGDVIYAQSAGLQVDTRKIPEGRVELFSHLEEMDEDVGDGEDLIEDKDLSKDKVLDEDEGEYEDAFEGGEDDDLSEGNTEATTEQSAVSSSTSNKKHGITYPLRMLKPLPDEKTEIEKSNEKKVLEFIQKMKNN